MLPWLKVPSNKSLRARSNGVYGSPLVKIYPPGVFYASSTSGAPGQPLQQRILPPADQNQATDPRALGGFWSLTGSGDVNSLVGGGTLNIGGNTYSNTTGADYSKYFIFIVAGLILYAIFK